MLLLVRGLMAQSRVVGKRILLVEDERWVRECIKRLLWVDSHAVTEAANGMEACELLDQALFDVVITDYDMPKMAGDALVIRIRARTPSQPIVMITGCSERFRGQENAADAILSKPFGIDELRQVLVDLLS